jgi:hypothetical protein
MPWRRLSCSSATLGSLTYWSSALDDKQIKDLLAGARAQATRLAEYRRATSAEPVVLSPDMAAALGSVNGERRLTPVLATVVEAISNKLFVDPKGCKAAKVKDTKVIAEWLGDNQWAVIERELYQTLIRDGTAYLFVCWSERPLFTVRPSFDGTTGALACGGFTLNAWKDGDRHYLDLYYPDRIEKYTRIAEGQWEPRRDQEQEPWPVPWVDAKGQPLGIPLIAFSIGKSDVEPALQIGRDINEAILDLVATSRLQGWPQRFLKGKRAVSVMLSPEGQPLIHPHTNRPIPRHMKLTPGSVMLLDNESELSQLEGATPNTGAIDKLLELLSLVTTVPTHYFKGEWPSGVALIQAESRLNSKAESHQGRLTSAIVEVLRLCFRLSNTFGNTTYDADQELLIGWHSPEIETEDLRRERETATRENVVALHAAKLMSLETALKALHPEWSEEAIQREVALLSSAGNQSMPADATNPQPV